MMNEQKFDIHTRTLELLDTCVQLSTDGASADRFHVIVRPNHISLLAAARYLDNVFDDISMSLVKIANHLVQFRQCGTWEASEWFSKLIEAGYLVQSSKESRSQFLVDPSLKADPKLSHYSKLFDLPAQSFADLLTGVCSPYSLLTMSIDS